MQIDNGHTNSTEKSNGTPSHGITITTLATLPAGTLLDERALATALEVSPRTIRRMVDRGELPEGVRLGARKVWFSDKVQRYLAERAEHLANEARKQAERIQRYG